MQLVPDIAAFLASHRRAFLVTVTSDGHPTVHPLSLINSDDGLFFNTYRKSAKVRNLRRDPHVACVVASADDDDPFRAIEVVGMAEVVDPDRLPDSLLHGSATDANGVMSKENLERVRQRLASGKRVYIRVAVEETRFCERLGPASRRPAAEAPASGTGFDCLSRSGRASAIGMSGEEILAFLRGKDIAVLGTLDRQGRPRASVIRYVVGPGRLSLAVPAFGPQWSDTASPPLACATVEEFPTYETITGVMVHGELTRPAPDEFGVWGEPLPPGFDLVDLFPDGVVSFDFKKIHQPARRE